MVNEKFFDLSPEKQKTIINAGLSIFARFGYDHSSTDMIAREAHISKGLLFHYFGNKKTFYLFLFDYAMQYFLKHLSQIHDYEETDFFRIIADAQLKKVAIAYEHPGLSQFLIQSYFEQHQDAEAEINQNFKELFNESREKIIKRSDQSKFKESISVEEAMNITMWMSEGFMKSLEADSFEDIRGVEAANDSFLHYLEVLRRNFYREEYV